MECDALDLHQKFIESQKMKIELANNLIEHANGNKEVIRLANEFLKECEEINKEELEKKAPSAYETFWIDDMKRFPNDPLDEIINHICSSWNQKLIP